MRPAERRDDGQDVTIPVGKLSLSGRLTVPDGAIAVAVFARTSESTAAGDPVPSDLQRRGVGTLLFDMLTPEERSAERHTRHLSGDVDLLAERVVHAVDWLSATRAARQLRIGLCGTSAGAAAALVAAAQRPRQVGAVVCRGGRPDLAGAWLKDVRAPTLLIVGALDARGLELNRFALGELVAPAELKIVPGASHVFAEAGAMEHAAVLSSAWFLRHFSAGSGTFPIASFLRK
jgi:dienelactone hydrolase